MIEYSIINIIFSKEIKLNYYFLILLTECNKKLFGCNNFIPMLNDIIKCNISKKKDGDSNEYDLNKNPIFLLPNNKNKQILRLLHFRIPQENYNISYGKDFWINFYNYYLEIRDIENHTINDSITNLFKHIQNYINTFIGPFKKILLEKYNIKKLNCKQLIVLYTHPKFGIDITAWNINSLMLLYDIKGFGDKTIIMIAKKLKFKIEDISKLIMKDIFLNGGNTYIKYDYDDWLDEFANYENDININNLSIDIFNDNIESLVNDNIIIKITENILCDYKLFMKESYIAESLIKIQYSDRMSLLDILNKRRLICTENDITNYLTVKDKYKLDNEQKQGIINIFKNNVSVIHGKAGCGKTTLLKGFIKCVEEYEFETLLSIFFLAPTAKAKMKMKESISESVDNINKYKFDTMHSFNIKLDKDISNYKKDFSYKFNVIIIDETSMIDIILFNEFLHLINDPTYNFCIVLLGDYRQLPSIGSGNILQNIINSKKIPCTKLLETYRYLNKITLKNTIEKILIGEEISLQDNTDYTQFKLITIPKNNIIEDIIKKESIDHEITITALNADIDKYTNIIRDIKNPMPIIKNNNSINDLDEVEISKIKFRVNDPVIHTLIMTIPKNYITD